MSWNPKNRAHASLWIIETWHHDQRNLGFDEVGQWKTDFIVKSAAGESASMRSEKADTHAEFLDEVFTSVYRVGYEADKTPEGAVTAMSAVLKNKDKLMSDLADVVDAQYRFRGET